ncbi:MAG: Flp pilus assembly complex ATPase component TadA [Phycisphaerae bacterium]|nr:Flp pilus assembly complex ATPase component TadA [Phycisphaerae bacterium]
MCARKQKKRLGDILKEWNVITDSGLREALEYTRNEGVRIGEALVALGLTDEEDVTKALALQYDMEYVDLDRNIISASEATLLPEDRVKRHLVIPMARDEKGRLKVIITDPLDLETLDMLRFMLNEDPVPCLASRSKVRAYIDTNIGTKMSVDQQVKEFQNANLADGDAPMEIVGDDEDDATAPVVRLVSMIITEAVNMRASDIHVEPMANRVRVRYRIDGVCIERDNIPKRMQGPVVNRFKILSGMDLAEKRVPLDGRIKMRIAGTDIDFRVSALPAYHGESVVLRILRPDAANVGITALGFEEEDNQRFHRIIKRPNGIFLVTGPTGSGKTTTLYSALNELNRPDRKIITAEDPVEYNFTGINQCQVRDDIGLTFASILRSMLRQAPNIILVGEIRDLDVAEVAIQAALTGHLVFSTLHTNDAPSAITRLIDMGVKPFLVASSIQAIMAQRLVRKICANCKDIDSNPDPRTLKLLGFTEEEVASSTFYIGRGCNQCNNMGYRGRQGIFELMEMNTTIRQLAFDQAPLTEIRKAAIAAGMTTLLEDGKRKIRNGITTPTELVRITQSFDAIEA